MDKSMIAFCGTYCGECADMPCQKLQELFDDPEHGDKGVRLGNLQNWKNGNYVYDKLGNAAQEEAKKLNVDTTKE